MAQGRKRRTALRNPRVVAEIAVQAVREGMGLRWERFYPCAALQDGLYVCEHEAGHVGPHLRTTYTEQGRVSGFTEWDSDRDRNLCGDVAGVRIAEAWSA
jgi:hypothetical protein